MARIPRLTVTLGYDRYRAGQRLERLERGAGVRRRSASPRARHPGCVPPLPVSWRWHSPGDGSQSIGRAHASARCSPAPRNR
ncbi:hypothetical protein BTH42_23825 [Burkholderia sp. SRS-W-2-2016]|nr:hypothetical protein BTH42_23825 [Burkholderia sp. SRS-W-2-2016]